MEDILILFVDLCVDLKKPRLAKDGLHQYRVICQNTNVSSMSFVIKHFLEASEKAAESAQAEAELTQLKEGEKNKLVESVESKLLSSVSGGEDAKVMNFHFNVFDFYLFILFVQDRADREYVTPWLKFLWETYKTVLDILRTNQKLEGRLFLVLF
jgi:translation initiation factor 3 subunit A